MEEVVEVKKSNRGRPLGDRPSVLFARVKKQNLDFCMKAPEGMSMSEYLDMLLDFARKRENRKGINLMAKKKAVKKVIKKITKKSCK